MRIRNGVALAAAVIIGVGVGIPAIASAATAPGLTYYGCIRTAGTYSRMLTNVYEHPVTCPRGSFGISWNQTGTPGDTGATGPQGPAGASYAPVTAVAVTSVTNDPDSGNHGTWATDTFTRSMTVTRHGAVAVSDCGGTATNGIAACWYYTAAMTDSGSFLTVAGANSPQAGTVISGTLAGTMSGGSNYEFYAASGAPSAATVPASFDASGGSGSGTWPERFFPAGTAFGGMNEINWVYTYTAPTTCERWADAFDNGDGSLPADGDITGVNACKAG